MDRRWSFSVSGEDQQLSSVGELHTSATKEDSKQGNTGQPCATATALSLHLPNGTQEEFDPAGHLGKKSMETQRKRLRDLCCIEHEKPLMGGE
jgi:hypothetical protein